MPPQILLDVLSEAEERVFGKGDVVVKEGESSDSFYIIESGSPPLYPPLFPFTTYFLTVFGQDIARLSLQIMIIYCYRWETFSGRVSSKEQLTIETVKPR